MSRFYATIQGGRGAASRQGHTSSGITGHIRGWRSGVRVWGHDRDGVDVFHVTLTGGSAGAAADRHLGTVELVDGEPVFVPPA